ncbi:MAG: GntR family transcriptional regulator [Syntrophomonadaceae bacterium]|jgi:DNA-binding GntR family transcriptional regulator|nr:GntR family transcriptional regulator [Syntrophomonadaceae bacterium]
MEEKRLQPVNFDSYKPLRELVLDTLRAAIINGNLHPGERLMEIQLADELGVSRTPVREALRKLELEGFIVMTPRKGAYVVDMSLKDVVNVFEIRAALEGLAAALAAERITEEEIEYMEKLLAEKNEAVSQMDISRVISVDTRFHDALYAASRNDKLLGIVNNLRDQIQRFRTASLAYPGRMQQSLREHRLILEAIQSRNSELSRQAAQEHVENAENGLLETIKNGDIRLT